MRAILALTAILATSGCVTSACRPVTVVKEVEKVQTKTVFVHDTEPAPARGTFLIQTEKASEPAQDKLASRGSIRDIQTLIGLRLALRLAFVPLNRPGHRATDAEVRNALMAYAALQAFLEAPHQTRKWP